MCSFEPFKSSSWNIFTNKWCFLMHYFFFYEADHSWYWYLFSCRPVRQALAVNNGLLLVVVVVVVVVVRLPQDILFWALNWIKLVQNGSNLSKLEHTCPKWIKLVQTWSNLSKMDQTCPKWIRIVLIGSNLSKWNKLGWNGSNLFKFD